MYLNDVCLTKDIRFHLTHPFDSSNKFEGENRNETNYRFLSNEEK